MRWLWLVAVAEVNTDSRGLTGECVDCDEWTTNQKSYGSMLKPLILLIADVLEIWAKSQSKYSTICSLSWKLMQNEASIVWTQANYRSLFTQFDWSRLMQWTLYWVGSHYNANAWTWTLQESMREYACMNACICTDYCSYVHVIVSAYKILKCLDILRWSLIARWAAAK